MPFDCFFLAAIKAPNARLTKEITKYKTLNICLLNTNFVIKNDNTMSPEKANKRVPTVPFEIHLNNYYFPQKTPPNTSFYEILGGIMININYTLI